MKTESVAISYLFINSKFIKSATGVEIIEIIINGGRAIQNAKFVSIWLLFSSNKPKYFAIAPNAIIVKKDEVIPTISIIRK